MKVFFCLALFATAAFAEPPQYRQQGQQRYFFARQQEESSGPYPARGWRPDGPAFNLPQRQQQQPTEVDNGYGPPEQPQQQYGPPSQQYGAPQGPSPRQQAPPAFAPEKFARQQKQQPQQQYGAPEPQEQYGAPVSQQQPRFRARQQQYPDPQGQYGPPSQQYGAPSQQYGAPEYTTTEVSTATEIDEPTTVGGLPETESEQVSSVNELEEDGDLDGQPRQQQERGEYYVALPDGRLQRVRYVSRQDIEAMRYFAKIRAENVEPLRGPIYAYSPLQKLEVAPGNLQISAVPTTLTVTATESKPQKLVRPKVDIKPLAQVQIQHDNPAPVVPLSSSYTTYTANYQVPATEERYIVAFP